MTAAQFDAEIQEGVLALPPEIKGKFEGKVRVILVKTEATAGDDLIAELLANPVETSGFVPFTREDANDNRTCLSKVEWEGFYAKLDEAPKDLPELRRLLQEPSIFVKS